MKSWQQAALDLYNTTTLSQRAIARIIEVPKSTVNDFLRSLGAEDDALATPPTDGPKVLVFDIETSPVLGYVWSLWNNNVGLNQIRDDWFILSWAAKWYGEGEPIMYQDQRDEDDFENDKDLLQDIWNLLDQADIVITHNGKKFDSKKLNARFILNGMQPPSSYRHIDTLEIAKRHFAFTSNKLAYLSDQLCPEFVKSDHAEFPGFELWKECLKGNQRAWEEMEAYNRQDVLALEAVYNALSPWSNSLPNFDVYRDDFSNGSILATLDLVENGFAYTNLGKYQKYTCKKTGQEFRGRVNLLSKEKRGTLKASIK